MRESFAEKTLNFISKYNNYTELEQVKLKYGFEVLYTIITKTFGILIITLFLKTLKEALILMALYGTLRTFGHGIHASKSLYCWIASILCYGIFPLIVKFYVIPKNFILYIGIISIIFIILWAPADTPQKPIVNRKKRIIDKIITTIVGVILLFITQKYSNSLLNNSIFFAYIMSIIAISPLTYKIFNIPYNNYKNFK